MKKLILSLLLAPTLLFGAATGDLLSGLDITGQSSVTAAQLLQMVNSGKIAWPKGGVIRTNNLPNLVNEARLTNWLWLDSRTTPATLKGYIGDGSQNSETNWVATTLSGASVGSAQLANPAVAVGQIFANAVVTSNLANNAVTDVKISAGAINNSHLQGGSVSNANIALATITGDRVAAATLTGANIQDGSITSADVTSTFINSWITGWVTNGMAIPADATVTNAHPLGAVPSIMQLRLVCNTAQYGYNAGDEVEAMTAMNGVTANPTFTFSADAANFYVTLLGSATIQIRTRTNAFLFLNLTNTNWRLKANLYKITLP